LGAAALALGALAPAYAAKDSGVLAKVYGDGRTARITPDGNWVASWVQQADGSFTLYVIDAKGAKLEADTSQSPGGITWIPGSDKLLYCKAVQGGPTKVNHVTYFLYDPKAKSSTRLTQLDDSLETYAIDPIAAEDGSRAFALTMDPSLHLPSFDVYFQAQNKLRNVTVPTNIGSLYDLSADGQTLYWWLKDPKTNCMNIVVWDMNKLAPQNVIEFPRKLDPAEDWALFKIDAPNKEAAISTYSSTDPTLQLCVYNFSNPKNLYVKAIHMGEGEQITYFDWKGFGGTLYAVVNYTASKEYGLEEIDATTGQRTQLYRGSQPLEYVEYSPVKHTYFFSIVDNAGSPKAETEFLRWQASQ
jgi:hypothetical protein